jgi:hypothetical protein
MRKSSSLPLSFAVVAALAVHAAPAHACSAFACLPPELSPATSAVPANLGAFFLDHGLTRTAYATEELEVVLEQLPDAGAPVPLSIDRVTRAAGGSWLVPEGPLEVGSRYRLSATKRCAWDSGGEVQSELLTASPLEFEVTPAAVAPDSLGATLKTGPDVAEIPVSSSGGGCWERLEVHYIDVQADYAGVDARFRPLLTNHRVIVDGEPFSWRQSATGTTAWEGVDPFADEPWRQPGVFRLWTYCGTPESDPEGAASYGLAPGTHQFHIEAEVPGPDGKVVRSATQVTVLTCDETQDGGDMADDPDEDGTDAGAHGDDASDGAEDGEPADDEHAADDGPSDEGDDITRPERKSRGCAAAPSGEERSSFALFVLAGAALWHRTRRRAR